MVLIKNSLALVPKLRAPEVALLSALGLRPSLLSQGLIQFLLVEEPLLGLELPGIDYPHLPSVSPIHTEDACSRYRDPQVKKPRLGREPG